MRPCLRCLSLLVLIFLGSLAGCSGDDDTASPTDPITEGEDPNTIPVACFQVGVNANLGAAHQFDASCSTDVEDSLGALTFYWDWNADLTFDDAATGDPLASHTFPGPGWFTVYLKVEDSRGAAGYFRDTVYMSWGLVVTGSELPWNSPISDELANSHGIVFSAGESGTHITACGGGRPGFGPIDPDEEGTHQVDFVVPRNPSQPATITGQVEIVWGDGGGDMDYLTITCLDIDGNTIADINAEGSSVTYTTFDVTGAHSLVFHRTPGIIQYPETCIDRLEYPLPVAITEEESQ